MISSDGMNRQDMLLATGAVALAVHAQQAPAMGVGAKEVLQIGQPLVTFVIDPNGKIVHIDEGSVAIDPAGALTACSRKSH